MMPLLRIVARMWSHIVDLRLYIRGQGGKTMQQIETEITQTEEYCHPYAENIPSEIKNLKEHISASS